MAALFIWFFFFYNIERLSEPINVATFVYIFVAVCAVFIILLPSLQRMPLYWAFLIALLPYFVLKIALGYQMGGAYLTITVTEVSAIWLTIVLSGQMGKRLGKIGDTIHILTLGQQTKRSLPFKEGQGLIYREIRRARRYHRPATLLAIAAEDASVDLLLDRFILDAQREIIHQYVAARIATVLMEELQDSDVITQRNSHFIALLPETKRENVGEIIQKIEAVVKEKLGLKLKIGLSTFPEEAVTFESLLKNAETKMENATDVGEGELSLSLATDVYQD